MDVIIKAIKLAATVTTGWGLPHKALAIITIHSFRFASVMEERGYNITAIVLVVAVPHIWKGLEN
jgi:hypothetical protein